MVKVNAPIDEGIAPLVLALSAFEGLETLESCQGHAWADGLSAFVVFRFGNWRTCGSFLFDKLLAAMEPDLRTSVSVSIVGYSAAYCQGRISLSPAAIDTLADLVKKISRDVSGGALRISE